MLIVREINWFLLGTTCPVVSSTLCIPNIHLDFDIDPSEEFDIPVLAV